MILPTYNEVASLRSVIVDFEKLNLFDEIIVVNNNAMEGTSQEILKTSAIEVQESQQGYGHAIKRGIETTTGEYVAICEPDSTFVAEDIFKLLPFLDRSEMVIGTRTASSYILDGANMGSFLKWGNWFVAKMIEGLFNFSYLSDVGCTYRVFRRESIAKMNLEKFQGDGSFGMEFLLRFVMQKKAVTQVPVNYKERLGVSHYSGDFLKAFKLGSKMIGIIMLRRIASRDHYEKP